MSQCDTRVSGVLLYCNSFHNNNPVAGYFVGFRVADHTGCTLNVVDLNGHNTMNRGKRVANEFISEPANYSIQQLQITGTGADTLEYWYFGPYSNGSTFNVALIDPNNNCDTIFVASGTYSCADNQFDTDPMACDSPAIALFYIDFSKTVFDFGDNIGGTGVYDLTSILPRSRGHTCCDVPNSNKNCHELIIRLSPIDIGLAIDDIGSGNTAGRLYADSLHDFSCTGTNSLTYPFQQDNGQSNDLPLCFNGSLARDYIVLSCKSGNNETGISIGAIRLPPAIATVNCNGTISVSNIDSLFWSSPDDPTLANLVNCSNTNTVCGFQYNPGVFGNLVTCSDTFTYIVGGRSTTTLCLTSDTILYDTVQVIVLPPFTVSLSSECMDGLSVHLTATVSSLASGCSYAYHWSTGETTPSIIVPVSNAVYSVTVTQTGFTQNVINCSAVTASISANTTSINCPPDVTIQCTASTDPSNTGTPLAADICNLPLTITHTDVNNPGTCPQAHNILRTWKATNSLGAFSTCLQTIHIIDSTPPLISCPVDVTIQCTANTNPVNTGMATSTDNCDPVPIQSYTDVTAAGSCPQAYTIFRTWKSTDHCGNFSTCLQHIQLTDNINPVITCPPDITISYPPDT
ncbi:MAG TPA: hypothetical protein VJ508_20060, partial [Saprospiraceae bacterium]|nr:hypothetical protein [Saprospiraceae bacterium]